MKILLGFLVLFLSAPPCLAELTRTEESETIHGKNRSHDVEVYRLTVTPAAEPSPVFSCRLKKRRTELKEGNAPAFYRRMHAENYLGDVIRKLDKDYDDQWYDWTASRTALSEVPLEKLRTASELADQIVREGARRGADCREVDWGLGFEQIEGPEVITFLLPEFQGMRSLCRLASLQTRLAIAERRYQDAIDLLRVNYRMGQDAAQPPILVCGLIGIAMAGVTNDNTLDLIAAPGSPNLYWALSAMPEPLISLREAVELETDIGARVFPLLQDAEQARYSPQEWNRRYQAANRDLRTMVSSNSDSPGADYLGIAVAAANYGHAKSRLVDWGYGREEVDAMAVGQVLAIYSKRVYDLHSQAIEKEYYLSWPEIMRRQRAGRRVGQIQGPLSDDPDREILGIASGLTPATQACRNAEARLARDFALLRAIEAVRMHAAEEGHLPDSLEQVTCVPVPLNPSTGKPFEYAYADGLATFTLPLSDGHHFARRYEIRLVE